jgi:hypothetical protein
MAKPLLTPQRAWLQVMHLASGQPVPPILLPLRPAVVPIQPAGVDFSQVMLETPAAHRQKVAERDRHCDRQA